MIFPSTGEVEFVDGLRITAHADAHNVCRYPGAEYSARALAADGWTQHLLGVHQSHIGAFEVEVISGPDFRVHGALLSHTHSFYDPATPEDTERRAFHNGIIAADLRGQREFAWGHVFCRVDPTANRDWLVIIYSPFCGVPLQDREVYKVFVAHARNEDPC